MAILSNIHLTAGDDGLTIVSTDMEVSLVTTCPLTSKAPAMSRSKLLSLT